MSTLSTLRTTYNFSRCTAAYTQAARIDSSARLAYSVISAQAGSAPALGRSQNGFMVGMRHCF